MVNTNEDKQEDQGAREGNQDEQNTNKAFQVKLFQSHTQRSHTETFTIEAENAKEAEKKAKEFIAKEKDLEKDTWDLEVVDPTENTPGVPGPTLEADAPMLDTAGNRVNRGTEVNEDPRTANSQNVDRPSPKV